MHGRSFRTRWIPLALAVLAASGCSDFLDVNEDPNAPENARVDLRLPAVIATFGHSVLFGSSSLWGAEWTQQFSYNRDLRPYTEIHRYELSQTDAQGHWDFIFSSTMNEARSVMLETEKSEDWHYHGIAKFIFAWTYSIVTDLWGPVPFTDAFNTSIPDPKYDDQQSIYVAIHTMLDEAIEAMQRQAPRSPTTNDMLFAGDMARWVKLARTVQARLHMRLAYAPGENSADRAQKALTALQSGILSNAEDADFAYPGGENGLRNPRWTFQDLEQLVASEFVVERLKSRNDPRLPIMVTPAQDSLPKVVYLGHRNGGPEEPDSTFSWIGTFFSTDSADLTWMSYAEAKFIEAEARLITAGAAAADGPYRDGIRAHMQKLGVASAAIDAYIAARPSLATVPNALEEIINEKYMANYLTLEAWNDWRRTGFPRLQIVEGAVLPDIPYRIRTPGSELSNNAANVAATGIPTGLEGMNVKVWWASGN
jgi:hypothetical protein